MTQQFPKPVNFMFGGLAGMGATMVVQPLDLLKNRLQMAGEGGGVKMYNSTFDAALKIMRTEGVLKMWNGISAGLLRQATYTTTRLGIFSTMQDWYIDRKGRNPNFFLKVCLLFVVCLFVCFCLLFIVCLFVVVYIILLGSYGFSSWECGGVYWNTGGPDFNKNDN